MAPLTIRDDFPSSSAPNTAVIIGIVAGVIVALSILMAIVRAASRASESRPQTQTRTAPRPQVSGYATDYLRPEETRATRTSGWVTSTRTAGNNDTIFMRENDGVVMTLGSDMARVSSIMSPSDEASVPLFHAPASPPHSAASLPADGRNAHPSAPTSPVPLTPVRRPASVVAASVRDADPPPPYSVVSNL